MRCRSMQIKVIVKRYIIKMSEKPEEIIATCKFKLRKKYFYKNYVYVKG